MTIVLNWRAKNIIHHVANYWVSKAQGQICNHNNYYSIGACIHTLLIPSHSTRATTKILECLKDPTPLILPFTKITSWTTKRSSQTSATTKELYFNRFSPSNSCSPVAAHVTTHVTATIFVNSLPSGSISTITIDQDSKMFLIV